MTQGVDVRNGVEGGSQAAPVVIEWAAATNLEGEPMRWLGSWLVRGDSVEGSWFYSGRGNERTEHVVPSGAYGIRVRKWLSEGMDPEYVDVDLNGDALVRTGELDFNSPQPHRVFHPSAANRESPYGRPEE